MYTWEDVAKYCYDAYGWYVDWDERFFECGECANEPIYEEDFGNDDLLKNGYCPVCGAALMETCKKENWFDEENDDEEEEEE